VNDRFKGTGIGEKKLAKIKVSVEVGGDSDKDKTNH